MGSRRTALLAAATGVALLAAPLHSQADPSTGTTLPRGARVRVTAPRIPERLEARLDTIRGDTLHLNAGATGYAVSVPIIAVRRVEVPDGRASRTPRTVIGAAAGGVIGGIAGYQTALLLQRLYPDCAKCEFEPLPSERRDWLAEDRKLRWVWAAGIGVVGGVAAGIAGHRRNPAEAWRDVSLPLRVAVAPGGHGVSIGFDLETR